MAERPDLNPVPPNSWIRVATSASHPNALVYEGPCASCGKIIRRSSCHFRTRTLQLCSKACLGKSLEVPRDSIRRRRGRVWVYRPDHPFATKDKKMTGYILRSHAIVEDALGRYLNRDEIIHHKNEDPSDDRLDNFEITNRSDHRAHHAAEEKVKYGTIARWK